MTNEHCDANEGQLVYYVMTTMVMVLEFNIHILCPKLKQIVYLNK